MPWCAAKTVGALEQNTAEQINVEIGDHYAFLANADSEPVLVNKRHGCRLGQLNLIWPGESVELPPTLWLIGSVL